MEANIINITGFISDLVLFPIFVVRESFFPYVYILTVFLEYLIILRVLGRKLENRLWNNNVLPFIKSSRKYKTVIRMNCANNSFIGNKASKLYLGDTFTPSSRIHLEPELYSYVSGILVGMSKMNNQL